MKRKHRANYRGACRRRRWKTIEDARELLSTRQADNFQYVSYLLTGRPTNFRQSTELSWWSDVTTQEQILYRISVIIRLIVDYLYFPLKDYCEYSQKQRIVFPDQIRKFRTC